MCFAFANSVREQQRENLLPVFSFGVAVRFVDAVVMKPFFQVATEVFCFGCTTVPIEKLACQPRRLRVFHLRCQLVKSQEAASFVLERRHNSSRKAFVSERACLPAWVTSKYLLLRPPRSAVAPPIHDLTKPFSSSLVMVECKAPMLSARLHFSSRLC